MRALVNDLCKKIAKKIKKQVEVQKVIDTSQDKRLEYNAKGQLFDEILRDIERVRAQIEAITMAVKSKRR